jgi:hypothetical protein
MLNSDFKVKLIQGGEKRNDARNLFLWSRQKPFYLSVVASHSCTIIPGETTPHLTLFTIFALIEHCLGDKDMVAIGSESQPP